MEITLPLLFLFMGLTLLILLTGLVIMIKGGKLSQKWSNKLMVFRVAAQGIAIALLGLIYLLNQD